MSKDSEVEYCNCDPDCGCRGRADKEQRAAIKRVRELHKPVPSLDGFGPEACEACSKLTSMALGYENWVAYGFCPTIKALDGEQE